MTQSIPGNRNGRFPSMRTGFSITASLIGLVLSALAGSTPVAAFPQEIVPAKDPQSLFAPANPPAASGTKQESQIATLESIRRNLNDSIESEPESVGNKLRQTPQQSSDSQTEYWDLLSSELETSRQVEILGDRIQRLVKMDRERKRREREGLNDDSGMTPGVSSRTPGVSGRTPGVEAIAAGIQNPPAIPVDTENVEAMETSRSALETTRVLSEPPDHLALADSLFFSGETVLALDLYRKARHISGLETDETWVRYQIACCLRRIRKIDEANRVLREIAESEGTDPVGSGARWWLDTINRKQLLQSELDTFRMFIENREANNATDQNKPGTDP